MSAPGLRHYALPGLRKIYYHLEMANFFVRWMVFRGATSHNCGYKGSGANRAFASNPAYFLLKITNFYCNKFIFIASYII